MLILVRHGQTTANAERRLLGRLDAGLTPLGRRQAERVAAVVHAAHSVERVISSPLVRARDTASAFGLPIEVDDRWIELDYGPYDGVPLADVPPDLWSSWRSDPEFALPGGESLAAVGRRVRSACEELAAEAARHDVVVVSHVSPIKAAAAWALGVSDTAAWRMFLATASVTRVGFGPNGPSLHGLNEVPNVV